jgi:ribokinase
LAPALPIEPALLAEIDLLIANEGEAATLGPDPARLAMRLRQGFVMTRGAAGSAAFLRDGTRLEVPALPIEPIDTTGAGDTFVGVLAAALDLGSALELALRRAQRRGGSRLPGARGSNGDARQRNDRCSGQSAKPLS